MTGANVNLAAEKFRNDPRVAEAKRLLQAALADAQQELTSPRGPRPELTEHYKMLVDRLTTARGGATYFPYLSSGLGRGPLVELADGSVKFDFITGIGVHGLGHSHPRMLEAGIEAAMEDTVMQGNLQQHPPSLAVCETLLKWAGRQGAPLAHCLLSTSGAMANENALKIAFHNRFPADRIIAIDNCFAGRSIATAQLTDRPQYRQGVPTALQVDYLPMLTPAATHDEVERAIVVLQKLIERYPNKHAALWIELVAGEGGYYPESSPYVNRMLEIIKAAGILVIFDEIQTFSRLSMPFAYQHFGLDRFADIVTLGKITQVCATLYRTELKPKGPLLSQTFIAASSSIAAALQVFEALEAAHCYGADGENMRRHQVYVKRMETLAAKYPGKVSGPYGLGMMFAMTPGDGSDAEAGRMVHMLYEVGLMGFIAGHNPARIRFLPPPAVTADADIEKACDLIEDVLQRF
ncbi:MAG: aminotransferase class III-fold pyridoxal phosphate-dependent enzyme [Pirellulales bacterium]